MRLWVINILFTHTFKQHKNTITKCKYIGSTWGKIPN